MNRPFPITKERIRHHLQYAWWQYMVLVIVGIFGWNLLFTTTRYQSPEHLKLEWYYEGNAASDAYDRAEALMAEMRPTFFPDMEELTFAIVGNDATYGDMQLMVWMAAGQGDLYMLTQEKFAGMAGNEAMMELQPYIDSGALNVEDIDLNAGYATNIDTGVSRLYGIPTDTLTKLSEYGMDPNGKVMCLLANGGNVENALKLMQGLIDILR